MSKAVSAVLSPFMPDAPKLEAPPLPEPISAAPALPSRANAVEQAAAAARQAAARRARGGRGGTVLTPLNADVPLGNIRRTVLGGS